MVLALAAFHSRSAPRVLAHKLAFRLGAFRFMAFPIAIRFFADCLTDRFWGLTMGHAMRGLANGHAFRTVFSLTSLIWTHDLAVGLLTFDVTNSVFGLLATGVAFGRLTDRLTDRVTAGIVTFPGTLRVTGRGELGGGKEEEEGEDQD